MLRRMALGANERRGPGGLVTDTDGRVVLVGPNGSVLGAGGVVPDGIGAGESLGGKTPGLLTDQDGRLIAVGVNGTSI